jgi:hypothetical protein
LEDGSIKINDSPELGKASVTNITLPSKSKTSYMRVVAGDNYDSPVEKLIKDIIQERSWDFQGVVLKDTEGNRWRFRSDKYLAVKSLRGNSSRNYERFAQLYSQNLVHKYLEYYPEDMLDMTVHLMLINSIIKTLYDLYVDLHITKTKKIEEIDKMFYPHLYNLHGLFLSQLRPAGKRINLGEIQVYFHKQPWQRIAFLIRKLADTANASFR